MLYKFYLDKTKKGKVEIWGIKPDKYTLITSNVPDEFHGRTRYAIPGDLASIS